MSKQTKLDEVKDLLEQLTAAVAELSESGGETEGATVSLPEDPDEVDGMDEAALTALCEAVGLDTEDVEDTTVKKQIKLLIKIIAAEKAETIDELAEEIGEKTKTLNGLAAGLKVKAGEEAKDTITDILAVVSGEGDGVDGKPDDEEKPAKKGKKAKEEPEGEETPKKGKKAKEEPEELDIDAIVEAAELPKEKVMLSRLEAYNEVCDKESEIDVEADTEAAYKELLKKCVTNAGEIAEWGEPYVNTESDLMCCGLPLEEVEGTEYGKCQVTSRVYKQDSEGNFTEVQKKSK